jgi:hypothetical protein
MLLPSIIWTVAPAYAKAEWRQCDWGQYRMPNTIVAPLNYLDRGPHHRRLGGNIQYQVV